MVLNIFGTFIEKLHLHFETQVDTIYWSNWVYCYHVDTLQKLGDTQIWFG